MSARRDFTALADLLSEASLFIDSLAADEAVADAMSEGQRAQAAQLVERLDHTDTAIRALLAKPQEADQAEETTND